MTIFSFFRAIFLEIDFLKLINSQKYTFSACRLSNLTSTCNDIHFCIVSTVTSITSSISNPTCHIYGMILKKCTSTPKTCWIFFWLQGLSWPYTTVICESKISSDILKCCRSLIYTATFCWTNFWVYLSALLLSKIKIFDYSSILSKNYDNFDSKLLSSQAIPRNGTILADLKRADPNRPELNRPELSRPKPNRILYWSWHKISKIVINYTIFSKNYSQLVVKLLSSYKTHRNGIVIF